MKFKNFRKANIGLTLAAIVVGSFGFASQSFAAPAFNIFPVTYTGQQNHDLPLLDARNASETGVFSSSQADHDDGVFADPGDEIDVSIYFHNGAANADENIAINTVIRAFASPALGSSGNIHTLSATIGAANTATVSSNDSSRGGNMNVHIRGSSNQTLSLVPGSITVRKDQGLTPKGSTQVLPDTIFSNGVNIGDVRGCFEFHGFVNFQLRVSQDQVVTENRDLTIQKQVLNVSDNETIFRDSTNANPGERVRFEIRFQTTGNASQNNVTVRDILPSELGFASGTMRVDGVSVSNEFDLFGSGRNFGSLSAGTARTITFEALVAGAGSFSGSRTLTNTANVRSDQVGTRQDTAEVFVSVISGIQFSQRKTAYNLTQGVDATSVAANPGDIIVYTLYVRNSGLTAITGHVIEDNIHDILELAEITNQGGATSVNSIIRFAPVDIPAGVEIARTFQIRVRDASLFPATSDLVMVNIFGNEIRVPVRKPQVAGVTAPPRTGAAEWLTTGLAGLVTAGYWLYRRRKVSNFNEQI